MNETRLNREPRFQMHVMVNGVYEWRDAEKQERWRVGLPDVPGFEMHSLPMTYPLLHVGEKLHETSDGTCFITTP